MIGIIDYGMGNLRSVQKAFESLGVPAQITTEAREIERCSAIILPGVGAFPDAMNNMKKSGVLEAVISAVAEQKPLLGICLGMQLLFEIGEEFYNCEGLGFLKGTVKRIEGDVKIPHMGWNALCFHKESPLLKGVDEGSHVYFVHSFYADIRDDEMLNASCEYGGQIPAIVSKGNIYGVQFHPEKSGMVGMELLKNFKELIQ